MYLIFDTETTGLPKNYNAPINDTNNWTRVVQLAWQLHDDMGNLLEAKNYIVKPDGFDIPFEVEKIHGISTKIANEKGYELQYVLYEFKKALSKTKFLVGHNVEFDIKTLGCEFFRMEGSSPMENMKHLDTCCEKSAAFCKTVTDAGRPRYPKLIELHNFLFKENFDAAHNAMADVAATARCFLELIRVNYFSYTELDADQSYIERFKEKNKTPFKTVIIEIDDYKDEKQEQKTSDKESKKSVAKNLGLLERHSYSHIHNHSQFSMCMATTDIETLINRAVKDNMPAIGICEIGNMYSTFEFLNAVKNANYKLAKEDESRKLKGVVGCEFFISEDYKRTKFTINDKDVMTSCVLFAKNKKGYHNLAKLCTIGQTDGLYGLYPRIGKELIEQYKDNLIALSGGLKCEIPSLILSAGEKKAEEAFLWWKELFGDDFYVELIRHGLEENQYVNRVLLEFCNKHNVKYIAQNETYYLDKEDSEAQDILICVKDGEKVQTPKGKGRGYRFGLPCNEFYFKSQQEMKELFADLPQAIINQEELIEKFENYDLGQKVLLPAFDIPEEFKDEKDIADGGKRGENAYLKYLSYKGAEELYGEITEEIKTRLDFELDVIEKTGYPGYFLIVQEFIAKAREMGVLVGPGRGSAAGSLVAYCTKITTIDPIKYDLLFERFLNPERISLPDIDVDFDNEGRGKIMDWVVNKYGKFNVAQIITYGSMAGKSALKDATRVFDLPVSVGVELSEQMFSYPKMNLKKLFQIENDEDVKQKMKDSPEELDKALTLRKIARGTDEKSNVVRQAAKIEGSLRQVGVHACGVIIAPKDLREIVPLASAKTSSLLVTQFDNHVVESAGLLKMDFLGLITLSIIRDSVINIKRRNSQINLDIDKISLEDKKTYELFQKGETMGVFQYESAGMQKYLKELKPTAFSDLIAMNALYRPGPLQYIPDFIARKHGEQQIEYDLPEMDEYLSETYGITVYQEQVMLLSQKLAGFTKGEADTLRKAMGKKIRNVLDEMKPKFISQAEEKGHPKDKLDKIWADWEKFAEYAFNKSHSTCYAYIAYQTAFLKANYPSEFMAAALSNSMNKPDEVTKLLSECKRMGIKILCPDVNESELTFSVNKNGDIRFGLGAVKGVGENVSNKVIAERENNGIYKDIFDFTLRIDKSVAGKSVLEKFAMCGAFDCFELNRAQYFTNDAKGTSILEKILKYAEATKDAENSAQFSLFGAESGTENILQAPEIPKSDEWHPIEKLKKEKEIVGLYISGHPLDDYRILIENVCRTTIDEINSNKLIPGDTFFLAGMISKAEHGVSKNNGSPYCRFVLGDFTSSKEFMIFDKDAANFRGFINENVMVCLQIRVEGGYMRKDGSVSAPRLRITNIELLSEMIKNNSMKLTIFLKLKDLEQSLIDNLCELFIKYEGNNQVNILVEDAKNRLMLDLTSKQKKVKICDNFIEDLKNMNILNFSIR